MRILDEEEEEKNNIEGRDELIRNTEEENEEGQKLGQREREEEA